MVTCQRVELSTGPGTSPVARAADPAGAEVGCTSGGTAGHRAGRGQVEQEEGAAKGISEEQQGFDKQEEQTLMPGAGSWADQTRSWVIFNATGHRLPINNFNQ